MSSKIISIKKLAQKLKKLKKRQKKIILCHGVFDIVHPGHVRHFSYAKSKADILVVSLTTDKYIKKGIAITIFFSLSTYFLFIHTNKAKNESDEVDPFIFENLNLTVIFDANPFV